VENGQYIKKEACKEVVESKRKVKAAACGAFRALHRNPESEANKCHTTPVAEPYGLWLTRNRKFFQEKLRAFQKAKELCRQATIAWRREKIPCDRKIALWKGTRSKCTTRQTQLQDSTCTLGKKMKDTCDKYDTCHDAQEALYRTQKPKIMTQEKDRKGHQKTKVDDKDQDVGASNKHIIPKTWILNSLTALFPVTQVCFQ